MQDGEHLGYRKGPDGRNYSLHFYGGNAVICGPVPSVDSKAAERPVPVVYRRAAKDEAEARALMEDHMRREGWTK